MITFDALTLKAFIRENEGFLLGARIQKIQQPTRRDFVFSIRKLGESKKLYININPKFYHLCFMSSANEIKRRIEIPKSPPMFCMLLRKYLENAKISKVNVPENERIVELYIEAYNELNEKIHLCLAIELMGKHANVILYNYDNNIILGCAHNVGSDKSREREVAGTLPYVYPPKQNKLDINKYSGNLDYDSLSKNFFLISAGFAQICQNKDLETIKGYVNLKNISPAISPDYNYYSLFEEVLPEAVLQKDVNTMIDNYFAHHQELDKYLSLQNHLISIVEQRLKRTDSSIEKINTQILREKNCDTYRLYGDLIMANLYSYPDYAEKIKLYDYENNKDLEIELNSTKTLKENANKFYKMYAKGKRSKQKLTELKEELMSVKSSLEQLKYFLANTSSYEELTELSYEIIDNNSENMLKHKSVEPQKVYEDNCVIYIGRNNRQNDYIVSKLAKDDDLWFHTKDCPGSHVLLKADNPSNAVILKCAKLAKQYSSGSNSSKVGVIYTKCKNLKKPPKAALGYVTYKNEKEIIVD